MTTTPKSLRLHIGIFGRTNTGKSSFLNMITGQNTAIVSPLAGTTTDIVEKSMELLPLGPVTFIDTAGIDDSSDIGNLRVAKTKKALAASDVAILLLEAGIWTAYEDEIASDCQKQNTPLIPVVNKIDLTAPSEEWLAQIPAHTKDAPTLRISCTRAAADNATKEEYICSLKKRLLDVCPDDFLDPPVILGDLLPSGRGLPLAVLIVPIDLQAPKGRLILPGSVDSRCARFGRCGCRRKRT